MFFFSRFFSSFHPASNKPMNGNLSNPHTPKHTQARDPSLNTQTCASETMNVNVKRSMYVPDYVAQFAKIKILVGIRITTASLATWNTDEMKWNANERWKFLFRIFFSLLFWLSCEKRQTFCTIFGSIGSVHLFFASALAPRKLRKLYVCITAQRWSEKCAFLHFSVFMDERRRCHRCQPKSAGFVGCSYPWRIIHAE